MIDVGFHISSGFGSNPETSKFEVDAHLDRISLVGQYKARGNILLLPIYGNGRANLTFGKPIIIESPIKTSALIVFNFR